MKELLDARVDGHHPITDRDTSINHLMDRVGQQTEKMQLWRDEGSPYVTTQLLKDEVDELVKAVEDDEEAFEVASEIGDVLYLALKFCYDVGINPADAVQMKILRNDLKYSTDMNSHGEYQTSRAISKQFWNAMGGDVAFSHAYLEVVGQILDEQESNSLTTIYEAKEADVLEPSLLVNTWNSIAQGNDYY